MTTIPPSVKNKAAAAFVVAAFALCATSGAARAQEEQGPDVEILAQTCMTCHGYEGRFDGPIPPIAGLPASRLRRLLMDFRDGARPSTIMQRIMKPFGDDDIAALAQFFAERAK